MILRMARPRKDPKTGVHHLRQRVPSDLAKRLKGGGAWAGHSGARPPRPKVSDCVAHEPRAGHRAPPPEAATGETAVSFSPPTVR